MYKTIKNSLIAIAIVLLIPATMLTETLFDNVGAVPETSYENFMDYATFEEYRIEERDELQYEQTPEEYLDRQLAMIPNGLNEHEQQSAESMALSLKDKYESYWENVN